MMSAKAGFSALAKRSRVALGPARVLRHVLGDPAGGVIGGDGTPQVTGLRAGDRLVGRRQYDLSVELGLPLPLEDVRQAPDEAPAPDELV